MVGTKRAIGIVVSIMTLFLSCTNDDDGGKPSLKTTNDLRQEIEGRYIGELSDMTKGNNNYGVPYPANMVVKKTSIDYYSLFLICNDLNIDKEIDNCSLVVHDDENGVWASLGKTDWDKMYESVGYWFVRGAGIRYENNILDYDCYFEVADYGETISAYYFHGKKDN